MHTIFKLDYYNFISTLNKQPQTLNLQKKMEKGHLSFIRVGSIFFLFFILLLKCGTFNKSEEQINSEKTALEKEKEEIIAEEKRVTTDSKGRRQEHWIDIFRGFFFIADFNKNFQGQTVVFRNSWFKLNLGKQRVKLENPNFEKQFDVFSTDQVEARYILTPNLMERLLELDSRFPGKITVSFRDSSVIIAIPDQTNHFETNIWECQLNTDKLKREFGTLVNLFQIIHDLNLNLRIWTKD